VVHRGTRSAISTPHRGVLLVTFTERIMPITTQAWLLLSMYLGSSFYLKSQRFSAVSAGAPARRLLPSQVLCMRAVPFGWYISSPNQVPRYSAYVEMLGDFFTPGCRHEVNVSNATRDQARKVRPYSCPLATLSNLYSLDVSLNSEYCSFLIETTMDVTPDTMSFSHLSTPL